MSYNPREVEAITISATGRIYIPCIGGASIQILSVAGGLTFTVEATHSKSSTTFSPVEYFLNGALVAASTPCTPSAGNIIDVTPGAFNFVVLNVSVGTGAVESSTIPDGKAPPTSTSLALTAATIAALARSATTRITTATTTAVLGAPGVLDYVIAEAALTGTLTIYDNTLAAGTIVTILPIGFVGRYEFNRVMSNGITAVTSAADRVVIGFKAA